MPSPTGLPPVTPADEALQRTRFPSWSSHFRRHTPKATVIRLEDVQPDFIEWLEEDGFVLPEKCDEVNSMGDKPSLKRQGSPVHAASSDEEGSESDAAEQEASARDFTALNARIQSIIDEYDGGVFPKLDWSAPSDAAWIVPGGTLRCTTPADVYLLLKSSDFVGKDVSQLRELDAMQRQSSNPSSHVQSLAHHHLVLKKYFAIPTSHEFRCFVRAGRLTAISQRDTGTFFDHLQPAEQQRKICSKLQDFHQTVLLRSSGQQDGNSGAMADFPLADYVWDAYLTRDQGRVFIIDINPYLERTDALLWTWPEVEAEAERQLTLRRNEGESDGSSDQSCRESLPPLRLVTSRAQTMQSFPTHAHNMVPSDVIGLSQGTDIASFARDFNAQLAEAVVADQEPANGQGEHLHYAKHDLSDYPAGR